MLDTSPRSAVTLLAERLQARSRHSYKAFRYGSAAFKVDFAVDGEVPWTYEGARTAGTVHLGGGIDDMVTAEKQTHAGRMPERPFVLVGQQYLADKTRSTGNLKPLYAYAHVPFGYTGDATQRVTDRIEEFAPGFRERIVSTHVRSPAQLAADDENFVGGDICTGANSPSQLVFRPGFSLSPYDTGVRGVYLCSAATPPGAGAHGMCGYHAARRALASLRRRGLSQIRCN
jgi:phytoene dehydrogenase-like protein